MKQLILPLNLPPTFDEKNFIVSQSNEDAYLWVKKWPNWTNYCLSLYGEEGCGKTHLSHLWEMALQAKRLTKESFEALSFETLLESSPFFILEEPQLISSEEKLFHLYNHILHSQGGLLVLSSTPPAHWEVTLPDLQSRLNAIHAVKIHPPDERLLRKVIEKKFMDLQIHVDNAAISFLLIHMERSFKSARFWVETLNTYALSQTRKITIPLIREILLQEERVGKRP